MLRAILRTWFSNVSRSVKVVVVKHLRPLVSFFPLFIWRILLTIDRRFVHFAPPGIDLHTSRFLGEFSLRLSTTYGIEREVFLGGFDLTTLSVVNAFINNGDFCVDVGANIGDITLAMVQKVGPSGKVYAFEPLPDNYLKLRKTIDDNPSLQGLLEICQMALGDTPGSTTIIEEECNRGNARIGDASEGVGASCDVTTLDLFAASAGINRIDFVKVDVEGFELNVFRGAHTVLTKLRPVLYYESQLQFERKTKSMFLRDLDQLLASYNYVRYKIITRDRTLQFLKTTYPQLSDNTLAVPEERISTVPASISLLSRCALNHMILRNPSGYRKRI